MNRKVKITAKVYPVTWSNGKITKYRAHIECTNGISIYGNPMPTVEDAKKDLESMAQKFLDAASLLLQSESEIIYTELK